MSYYQIQKGVKILQAKKLLKCKLKGIPARTYYKINYEEVIKLFQNKFSNIQKLDVKNSKTINKNKINNKFFINKELNNKYVEFLKYRNELKKKCTKTTINLQVKKLSAYDPKTSIQMLEQSMENGWTGLFEVKKDKKQANEFPDYYDKKVEWSIGNDSSKLSRYHKHLRTLGWTCVHSPTAGTIWKK